MKVTKEQLKQIIKEELGAPLVEAPTASPGPTASAESLERALLIVMQDVREIRQRLDRLEGGQ